MSMTNNFSTESTLPNIAAEFAGYRERFGVLREDLPSID
jgi:hypothetical protein